MNKYDIDNYVRSNLPRLFPKWEMPCRSLIVSKPYIDLILDNGKVWEMRSRKTHIRGRIGLIEAGSGCVVGETYIYGCSNEPISGLEARAFKSAHQIEDYDLLKKWRYIWYLRNSYRYEEPVHYKHPKGAVVWVLH